MKVGQFSNKLDVAMSNIDMDTPVRIVDMDGFIHDVGELVVDPEENVIWIRSKYTEDVKRDE